MSRVRVGLVEGRSVDVVQSDARRTRPRNRKQIILREASGLFASRGFVNVSMNDIAEAVGITAGALYRHFDSKAHLLDAVIGDLFDRVDAAAPARASLGEMIEARARVAAELPALGVIWGRDAHHLSPEGSARLRKRVTQGAERYVAALRLARPELSAPDATVLAWAIPSILGGPAPFETGLSVERRAVVLTAACKAVTGLELPSSTTQAAGVSSDAVTGALTPVVKREHLLAVAGRLFGRRGYEATSLADIARAVGASGPSIYAHFSSKADLGRAVLERASHALWRELDEAFMRHDTAPGVLHALVESYVALASRQPRLLEMVMAGTPELPPRLWQQRTDYLTEWTALLQAIDATVPVAVSRFLVGTAIRTVNDLARTGTLKDRNDLDRVLARMAMTVLRSAES